MTALRVMTRTLVGACHPVPALAVTGFATALAAIAGKPVGVCATLALAVLAGQLSIGWSNDRIDIALDRSAGRSDKPLARGAVPLEVVDRAIAAAVTVTIAASFALGWRAGAVHVTAVACGWLYNAGVKATAFSWLPYALSFGSLPAVATLAGDDPRRPTWWVVVAAALLGCTGHLTNALPDLVADRRFGITGLPHRLGARPTVAAAAATALAGTVVLVLGPTSAPSALRWAGLLIAVGWTAAGTWFAWRRPASGWPFYGTLGVVMLDLALLLLGPPFVG